MHRYLIGFLLLTYIFCLMLPFCRRQNNRCVPKWWTFSHVLLLQITSSIYNYNSNYIQSAVWNSRFFLSYRIQEVFQTVMLALLPSRWCNLSSKYLSPQISICVFVLQNTALFHSCILQALRELFCVVFCKLTWLRCVIYELIKNGCVTTAQKDLQAWA